MDTSRHPLEDMVADTKPHTSSEHQSGENILTDKKPAPPTNLEIVNHKNHISLTGIDCPALLLSPDLKIKWQNRKAIDQIWHQTNLADNGATSPCVFDLLFDPLFKRHIANFINCLEFFISHILNILTPEQIHQAVKRLSNDKQEVLRSILERLEHSHKQHSNTVSYLHLILRNGQQLCFEVVATTFQEGRLLVFETLDQKKKLSGTQTVQNVVNRFERIRRQPNPIKTPYIVLSASLNNASTFRMEMLSDEYWRLINDLCCRNMETVEKYGGIFGQHIENGFYAHFLPGDDSEINPLDIIECALEIKATMVDLGREWKIRKRWLHDVSLNICIHWENEYIGILPSSVGDIVVSFGEGLRVGASICQLAEDGQIWASKPLISKIPSSKYNKLRFGIHRTDEFSRPTLIRGGFLCAKNISVTQKIITTENDSLNSLPVTQIFDLQD